MEIGGLQKFSLLDYPGHLAAIIFTQGCDFRCPFCYNPMLVWPRKRDKLKNKKSSEPDENQKDRPRPIAADDLFDFLKKRRGKLDAVVISGGEPTVHADLPDFIARLRALDYRVKLDTNGLRPLMLKKLTTGKCLDYVAMDVKAAPDRYRAVTRTEVDAKKIAESVKVIMAGPVPYEFRTTLVPGLVDETDITAIGRLIEGAKRWYLQQFKGTTQLLNPEFEGRPPYPAEKMDYFRALGVKFVRDCRWR